MARDRYFLSIAVGPNPRHTRPLVATEDPDVVRAAVAAFMNKLPRPPFVSDTAKGLEGVRKAEGQTGQ